MKGSMLFYISTYPPQGSKLLVFSAVWLNRERFEENLTAKVQKLHRVGLNINCLTFDKKTFSLVPEILILCKFFTITPIFT